MLAIKNDIELNKLLGNNADFAQTGVVPNIHSNLKIGKKGKGKAIEEFDEDEEMEWSLS